MPRPSFTDEIEALAYGLANAMIAEHDARARPECGMTGYWSDVVYRNRRALMSRLSALEQELEGYRKREAVAAIYAKLPPDWQQLPPQEQTFAALPCTSEYLSAQTGFNGEEGG